MTTETKDSCRQLLADILVALADDEGLHPNDSDEVAQLTMTYFQALIVVKSADRLIKEASNE